MFIIWFCVFCNRYDQQESCTRIRTEINSYKTEQIPLAPVIQDVLNFKGCCKNQEFDYVRFKKRGEKFTSLSKDNINLTSVESALRTTLEARNKERIRKIGVAATIVKVEP